jgi:hypothetical protein
MPNSIGRLVGAWDGQYETVPPGRNGMVVFRLRAGSDTAYGEVAMTSAPPVRESQFGFPPRSSPREALLLAITFVQVEEAGVEGALSPYLDPDIGDRVTTRFHGAFANDSTLVGTFATRDVWGRVVRKGKWSATRTVVRATSER